METPLLDERIFEYSIVAKCKFCKINFDSVEKMERHKCLFHSPIRPAMPKKVLKIILERIQIPVKTSAPVLIKTESNSGDGENSSSEDLIGNRPDNVVKEENQQSRPRRELKIILERVQIPTIQASATSTILGDRSEIGNIADPNNSSSENLNDSDYEPTDAKESFHSEEEEINQKRAKAKKNPSKSDDKKKSNVNPNQRKKSEKNGSESEGRKKKERKMHTCPCCNYKTIYKANFDDHFRCHEGTKPFKCQFCDKYFRQISNRTTHEKIHRGIKDNNCRFCDYKARTAYEVRSHEVNHTGEKKFTCKYCNKKFALISVKNMHERIHNGDKNHSCKFCGKCFSHINTLKSHELIHLGNKPFKCTDCSYKCRQLGTLKRHQKSIHKLE